MKNMFHDIVSLCITFLRCTCLSASFQRGDSADGFFPSFCLQVIKGQDNASFALNFCFSVESTSAKRFAWYRNEGYLNFIF